MLVYNVEQVDDLKCNFMLALLSTYNIQKQTKTTTLDFLSVIFQKHTSQVHSLKSKVTLQNMTQIFSDYSPSLESFLSSSQQSAMVNGQLMSAWHRRGYRTWNDKPCFLHFSREKVSGTESVIKTAAVRKEYEGPNSTGQECGLSTRTLQIPTPLSRSGRTSFWMQR